VYPHFVLADDQWNKIARLCGIPPSAAGEARPELARVLGIHRMNKEIAQIRWLLPDVGKEMAAIEKDARKLRDRIRRLAELLPAGWSAPCPLEIEVLALPRTTGPKTGGDYILVSFLIAFAERHGGKKIRRSSKNNDNSREYLQYVCGIADPSIGPGTIDNAMKNSVRRRGQTVEQFANELAKKRAARGLVCPAKDS
jgi:hypothetical protein